MIIYMDIISHSDFGKLRLSEVWPENKEIQKVYDFEFMGDIWVGEKYGFTEWLQLENEPTVTRSISIPLSEIPSHFVQKVLGLIGLDLEKGMSKEEVFSKLGRPIKVNRFVDDRESHEYILGGPDEYYLSLTVQDGKGLTYVVFMNHPESVRSLKNQG